MLPPPEEMAILHDLAQQGNMKHISSRALYLEQLDERYRPLANHLKQLAQNFQEEAIVTLIEAYIGPANNADNVTAENVAVE